MTIIITIASSVAFSRATAVPPRPMKWEVVCLSVVAALATLVLVTRRHGERQAAHFQLAQRFTALAASCRLSVTRYEEKLIGDSEFQALLDLHFLSMELLRKDAQPL